jgi:chromosome segregation ATPase
MADAVVGEVSGAEKRRQALIEARRRDSDSKRTRVRDTVEKMLLASERITFAAVARQAKVSSWLVYADGVREHIQTAIDQQAEQPPEVRDGTAASATSLRTDLALARGEISRLRTEHESLRRKAQRLLGQQLDQVHADELRSRLDTLVGENRRLSEGLQQTAHENATLRARIAELEEDVAAARTALRRMIREQSADLLHQNCNETTVSTPDRPGAVNERSVAEPKPIRT